MAFRSKKSVSVLFGIASMATMACGGSKEEPNTQANANGQYGAPQGQYGAPQGQYGQPQGQYGQPQGQYGQPQGQYGQPQGQYGQPQGQYGQPQGQYGAPQGQYGAPPAQSGAPQQPAPGGIPGMPPMGGQGGPTAQQLDPSAGAAATAVLTQLSTGSIQPGAKPVGSPIVGNFQQGQTLEGQLQLQPGKCYTVVGAGVPPVSEVNLQLIAVMPIPGMVPVLAQDSDSGPQAVLGRKPNCYKWPLPMGAPVKVVVTVAGGSGIAAAQVYEK